MGRIYAGILGPLAFLAALFGAALDGATPDATLWRAWASLWAFAAVGYVVGRVADRTIEESVAGRVAAELDALGRAESAGGKTEVEAPGA